MNIRRYLKRLVPEGLLNRALVKNPWLYSTPLVRFEANLVPRQLAVLQREITKCVALSGDVVECGSSRCGSSIKMAQWAPHKTIFALDSFEGFNPRDVEHDQRLGSRVPLGAFTSTSYEYVVQKVRALDIANVVIIPGFFEDTLAHWQNPLCFALIDCDLELPVRFCLTKIFPWLVPGGIILIDDYDSDRYLGGRVACDSFIRERPYAVRLVAHECGMLAIQKVTTA